MIVAEQNSTPLCLHCGDEVPRARRQESRTTKGSDFCCDGCKSVHQLLHELKLDREYYALRGEKRGLRKPVLDSSEDFSALDLSPYRSGEGESSLDFFLEGIHCTACVWILERLPEMTDEILSARLDMGRAILRVRVTAKGRFETAAKLLLQLGYRPHAVLTEADAEERLRKEDRLTLKRMGVAAFAAMNVMIYSVSLYTGVDGRAALLFRGLSLLTGLPALTYSAWPFYRSALTSLRNRRVSIDLPISLAFIGGFIESVRQVALGTNLVYLDSLTSLVFLMLASRYALSRLERAELSKSGLLQSLLPSRVIRLSRSGSSEVNRESVRISDLKVGDRIELSSGEKVPTDGIVESGLGWTDLSFLTGETKPIRVSAGDPVYAGSRFSDGSVAVRVTARGGDTRLGAIESRLEVITPNKNSRTERSDRWASVFLAIVIGLAGVLLISFGAGNSGEAIRRSLSLLIIACPCALALATPLTLSRAFRLAASRGILIRDLDAFERVLEADRVAFDKTGTLTGGHPKLKSWIWAEQVSDHEKGALLSVAYTMESNARHPYGKAIARDLENRERVHLIRDLTPLEEVGRGVHVRYESSDFRLGRADTDEKKSSQIRFTRDGKLLADLEVDDELRAEAKDVVLNLKNRGFFVEILSGDSETAVRKIAEEAGIPEWKSRLSPEEKQAELLTIGGSKRAIVVGDGVNDALVLKDAFVGVAFNRGDGSSIEASLASADVAILTPNLSSVLDLLDVARRYRRTLIRNAIFSVLYNLAGASFAVAGYIHPLVAAIAMPVSALTVYFSTVIGLSDFREGRERRKP